MDVSLAIELVKDECLNACRRYPKFNSAHEGFSVMYEEVDELWDEIKKSPKRRDPVAMREETTQVAAMALRFLIDVCENPPEKV